MTVFVVERYLVGWTSEEVQALLAAVDRARLTFVAQGVRHLRSIVMADDETCLCVFEAASAEAVSQANDEAGLPVDRITIGEERAAF